MNFEEKGPEPAIDKFMEKFELKRLHLDFLERMVLLAIAGLGLITAFAWDDAFKDIFQIVFKNLDDLQTKLLYALILTLFTTLVSAQLGRLIKKRKRKAKIISDK